MLRRLSPAACLVAAYAGGVQDAEVLVQATARSHDGHRSQHSVAAGLGRALDTAMGLVSAKLAAAAGTAQPNLMEFLEGKTDTGVISMQRVPATAAEAGTFMEMNVGEDCEGCQLHWGDNIKFNSRVRLPSGVQKGDRIGMKLTTSLDVTNTHSPLSAIFMGDQLEFEGSCEMCTGSCKFTTNQLEDHMNATFPSFLTSAGACEGGVPVEGLSEIQLLEHSMPTPKINATYLGLKGHFDLSLSVINADGAARASAGTVLLFGDLPKTVKRGHVKTILARDSQKAPQGSADAHSPPVAQPGLLQMAVSSLVTTLANHGLHTEPSSHALNLMAANSETGQPVEHHHPHSLNTILVSNIDILGLEGGSNTNMSIDAHGCQHRGRFGSVACSLHFGESTTLSTNVHVKTTIDPGAHFFVTLTPRVSGPMSQMAARFLERFEIEELELPLCGDPHDFFLRDKLTRFYPPACGYYEFNLESPGHDYELMAADNIKVPQGPWSKMLPSKINVNVIPPTTVDARLKFFHNDGSTIADLRLELKLDKGA